MTKNKMNEIEKLLDKICEYLIKSNIKYSKIFNDGRINSSKDENIIINELDKFFLNDKFVLKNHYIIKESQIRCWYDFAIIKENDKDFFIPINIKSSNLDKNDNLNCKLGIYYVLTGLLPINISNESSWEVIFKELDKNINTYKDKDYYFLIANKSNNKDIFWTSLKSLSNITPNGNNLPFQAKWELNRKKTIRTHNESAIFILNTLKESIYKRAKIKDVFDKYINKHLKNYLK